jgi:hypothetical protein
LSSASDTIVAPVDVLPQPWASFLCREGQLILSFLRLLWSDAETLSLCSVPQPSPRMPEVVSLWEGPEGLLESPTSRFS